MGATYTRQSSYADGDVITAAHTNDEFNQLLAAFQASTGHTHDGTANEGGPITKLLGTSITIGDATSGTDITVTFDGESNDGVLKWMEDEDYFEFSDDILVASTEKIQFRDTAIYINSSTDGQLDLVADTEIQIAATTIDINGNVDVSGTLTVAGAVDFGDAALSNVGAVQLDSIAGDGDTNTSITFSGSDVITVATGGTTSFTVDASQNILMSAAQKVQFRDTALTINSSTDGQMDIDADTELEITAPTVDINASTAVLVSNDLKLDSDAAVLGFGADNDVTLTHVADTGLLLNGTMALQFNDASQSINAPSATVLDINATDEIELNATLVDANANLDVSGTYTGGGLMTTGGNIVIPDSGNIGSASDTDAIAIASNGQVTLTQTLIGTALDISGDIDVDGTTNLDNTDIDGTLVVDGSNISLDSTSTLNIDNSNTSNGITIGTATSGVPVSIGHTTSETTINDNLSVTGNFTVNGTTTTVNSTTVTIDDPIFTLGGDSAPGSDDNKDRGIEFRYHDGSSARVGFFGYDDSASAFTFLTAATNSSEVFSGTAGNVTAGVGTFSSLDISGDIDVDGTTNLDVVDIDGAVDMASTLTVTGAVTANAGDVKVRSTSGSTLELTNTTTSLGDNAFVGGLAFRNDDTSGSEPHYAGIKARTDGAGGSQMELEFYADRDKYEADTPHLVLDISGNLDILTDGATLGFGADTDVTLTHVADTGLKLAGSSVFQFRDSAINIGSPADGDLDINADDEIELNSTLIDINGAVDMSSTLQVDGAITSSAGMTITTADNTNQLTLVSTDADASEGPNLVFYRNSANPADNDDLSTIDFIGRNDNSQDVTYGQIKTVLLDASDGSEDARLEFYRMKGGTSSPDLQLNSEGVVINEGSGDVDFRVESNGNTHMLFVDAANNGVAIGHNNPQDMLHLSTTNAASHIRVQRHESDEALSDGDEIGAVEFWANDSTSFSGASTLRAAIRAEVQNTSLGTRLEFYTGNSSATVSERMRIIADGKIGINQTEPSRQLHITDTIANGGASLGLTSSDSSTTGSMGILHFGNSTDSSLASINGLADGSTSAGALLFKTEAAGAAIEERMRINSVGSVGIGVADGDVTSDGTAARTYVGIIGTANRGRLNIGSTASNGADAGMLAFTNGSNVLGSIVVDTNSGVQNAGIMYLSSTGVLDVRAAGGVIFNENSVDADFRVESNGNANMLFVDGGNDHVNIGTGTDHGGVLNVETSDNSVNLVLACTDTGGNEGPILDLTRDAGNVPGDNDVMGVIRFRNDNTDLAMHNYAQIEARTVDVSAGTEDGRLEIATVVAGTEGTSRALFDAAETVFNDNSVDLDFRVESNGNANMLVVDGGDDSVRVGGASGEAGDTFSVVESGANVVNSRFRNANADANGVRVVFEKASANPANNDEIAQLDFMGRDSAGNAELYAGIQCFIDDVTSSSEDGILRFSTVSNATSRNRLDILPTETVFNEDGQDMNFRVEGSGGGGYVNLIKVDAGNNRVGFGGDPSYFAHWFDNRAGEFQFKFEHQGDNSNRYGGIIQSGSDDNSGTNYHLEFVDGDATGVGSIRSSGGTVTYATFTASHEGIIPNADNDPSSSANAYPYGTLLETISLSYTQKNGSDSERGILYNVRKTTSANSRAVLGVYGSSLNGAPGNYEAVYKDGDTIPSGKSIGDPYRPPQTNMHNILVLGDGHILCNNSGGNIAMGDGIASSSTAGIGCKATANPSMIIGIAQEAITFSGSETKLVAVQFGLQQFTPWS